MNPHLISTREILLSIEEKINTTIIGQKDIIRYLIIALFARGHVLLEGVPGLGKTQIVKTLAHVLGYNFRRISFTPDLLPSDLTGHVIYVKDTGKFEIRKGPIFTSILLADEINRTPPKVQSALLEAMEEGNVTIAGTSLSLPEPFFVIATENPLEHEGTYPLPEAELDRFLMKLVITYPDPTDEKKIFAHDTLSSSSKEYPKKKSGETEKHEISPKEFLEIQNYIEKNIYIDEKIYNYISTVLEATRSRGEKNAIDQSLHAKGQHGSPSSLPPLLSYLAYGASTRAGLALVRTARVRALLEGRDYVIPEDITILAIPVLRHRIGLSYEAIAKKISPEMIIREIISGIRVS